MKAADSIWHELPGGEVLFDWIPAIIFDLGISKSDQHYRIEWSASYGASGFLTAKRMRIAIEPGKP